MAVDNANPSLTRISGATSKPFDRSRRDAEWRTARAADVKFYDDKWACCRRDSFLLCCALASAPWRYMPETNGDGYGSTVAIRARPGFVNVGDSGSASRTVRAGVYFLRVSAAEARSDK
jgi:hypothetical protein